MSYILVVDQGTTSSRSLVFNERGQPLAIGQHEIKQYYPQNAWVEHDAEMIWLTTLQACVDVLAQAKVSVSEIIGLGITNQRETTVVWNKHTGKPIYHAIVWQDRRTTQWCENLKAQGYEKTVTEKTGLLLDPYFSASKLAWLLDNIPNARKQAEEGLLLFGTIDTWILWQLTKGRSHYTDVTNASRTLLFNIHTQQWDTELLTLFNIPKYMLPEVKDNCADFGEVDKAWFGCAIPICAMAGDQQSAAFGQACFHSGMVKSTYGTGAFMLLHTGSQPVLSQHKLLTTIQYRVGDQLAYGLEGSIFIAGAAVQWLRDNLHLIQHADEIQALAEQVPDNGDVYFIPAFTGLGAPYWDPHARGMITGLTRDTQAGHLARATLEAVCYQTRDLLQAMQKDGAKIDCLRVDGGMTVNDTLMQSLADILAIRVERPVVIETTALGVAFLTGLQQGLYASMAEISDLWQLQQGFMPLLPARDREERYQKWLYWVKKLTNLA
ncbi:MAG: glycerol kinase GlpK [Legionellales bacterium]|nr:glycerol kinase GlpK [Legionellales bacterium]